MKTRLLTFLPCSASLAVVLLLATMNSGLGQENSVGSREDGKGLFEDETFGGNGRTCRTCHSVITGTVSPEDAQARFAQDSNDPLFRHDGSDDGLGNGVTRMLKDATVLMSIPLAPNIRLKGDPNARTVIVRRGIPTTLNTPALDEVLMYDGRQPNLQSQAAGAIHDHAQNTIEPTTKELRRIAMFQLTNAFFSSRELRAFARGGPAPGLPAGVTESEKRGRFFLEDVVDFEDPKHGLCAGCHAGPMLNETNLFAEIVFGDPLGTRFGNILVSEKNLLDNPALTFIFTNPDGSETEVTSPDPGQALITGDVNDVNFFKTPQLRGIRHTAPYFHDNSAKTLEDVMAHYAEFFEPLGIELTGVDQADMVAFMKLLD